MAQQQAPPSQQQPEEDDQPVFGRRAPKAGTGNVSYGIGVRGMVMQPAQLFLDEPGEGYSITTVADVENYVEREIAKAQSQLHACRYSNWMYIDDLEPKRVAVARERYYEALDQYQATAAKKGIRPRKVARAFTRLVREAAYYCRAHKDYTENLREFHTNNLHMLQMKKRLHKAVAVVRRNEKWIDDDMIKLMDTELERVEALYADFQFNPSKFEPGGPYFSKLSE